MVAGLPKWHHYDFGPSCLGLFFFNVWKEDMVMPDFYAGTIIGVLIGMFIKVLLLTVKDANQKAKDLANI